VFRGHRYGRSVDDDLPVLIFACRLQCEPVLFRVHSDHFYLCRYCVDRHTVTLSQLNSASFMPKNDKAASTNAGDAGFKRN
jgi:hypothetical protein